MTKQPRAPTFPDIFRRPLVMINPQASDAVAGYAAALMEKLERKDWDLIQGLLSAQRQDDWHWLRSAFDGGRKIRPLRTTKELKLWPTRSSPWTAAA